MQRSSGGSTDLAAAASSRLQRRNLIVKVAGGEFERLTNIFGFKLGILAP
jgi:hypothetical protein